MEGWVQNHFGYEMFYVRLTRDSNILTFKNELKGRCFP
jgi:hypothetical protein